VLRANVAAVQGTGAKLKAAAFESARKLVAA
jgi:hypothetical protein